MTFIGFNACYLLMYSLVVPWLELSRLMCPIIHLWLSLSQLLFPPPTFAPLSRFAPSSEGYCHISGCFNSSKSAGAAHAAGAPAGAASGIGCTSGGTCSDNGMRDNRKFGFGVEVISLEGFSISVCRSERAGLRLSLSGFIISGTGLSRPLSHEHPLSWIRDTESLSVSLFQISHLSVYHPPFPLPLPHWHLFIIQRTHMCCFFSIYAKGKDSRVAANAFLRAALFTLSMHIKWDMQRSCDLNSNYIQITVHPA